MNPPPTSLPTTSLWVIPMHLPQASCTLRQTWTGDRKKDTDVYNGLLDSEGEGEGGMIWENRSILDMFAKQL